MFFCPFLLAVLGSGVRSPSAPPRFLLRFNKLSFKGSQKHRHQNVIRCGVFLFLPDNQYCLSPDTLAAASRMGLFVFHPHSIAIRASNTNGRASLPRSVYGSGWTLGHLCATADRKPPLLNAAVSNGSWPELCEPDNRRANTETAESDGARPGERARSARDGRALTYRPYLNARPSCESNR